MILTPKKKKKYNLVYNNRFAILTRIVNLMQKFSLSLYIYQEWKKGPYYSYFIYFLFLKRNHFYY